MYFFPLVHAIPPSYMAHDNQSVTIPFPPDQGDEETWPIQALIREALSYAHTKASGASIQNYNLHPVFAESNWHEGGPGAACFPHGNDIVADSIYGGYTMIDPRSPMATTALAAMDLLVKTPIYKEAATLAGTNDSTGPGSSGTNLSGSDNGNLISTFTGGLSKILENTAEGTKRT